MDCNMKSPPRNNLPCGHYIRGNKEEPGFCKLGSKFRCTEALKHHLPAISYSSVVDYIQCKMKYYLYQVQGFKTKPEHLPDPMKAGGVWDKWLSGELIETSHISGQLRGKIGALIRAYTDLEIEIQAENFLSHQYKISYTIEDNNLIGFVDEAYEDHIEESKLSGRPDFYTRIETIELQQGTYLLANESWEYVDMKIVKLPDLKTGKGKMSDESPEAFENRCYQDILTRPGHYFLGFDRKKRTYGKRFWRSEFDLDKIWKTYRWVLRELRETIDRDSWYCNTLACHVPTQCLYHPICKTGVVSEEIYYMRGKEGRK